MCRTWNVNITCRCTESDPCGLYSEMRPNSAGDVDQVRIYGERRFQLSYQRNLVYLLLFKQNSRKLQSEVPIRYQIYFVVMLRAPYFYFLMFNIRLSSSRRSIASVGSIIKFFVGWSRQPERAFASFYGPLLSEHPLQSVIFWSYSWWHRCGTLLTGIYRSFPILVVRQCSLIIKWLREIACLVDWLFHLAGHNIRSTRRRMVLYGWRIRTLCWPTR